MLLWGARILQRMSPLAWIAGGVVVALSIPAVRTTLRSAAVTATAGVMSAADNIKGIGSHTSNEISNRIQDAQDVELHQGSADSELVKAGL